MKGKRVLVVTRDYTPGGGGISAVTRALEAALTDLAFEIRVLSFDSRTSNNYRLLRARDLLWTRPTFNSYFGLHRVLNPLLALSDDGGLRAFVHSNMINRVAGNVIREFDPAIVHITHVKLFCAVYERNVPFILSCYSEEINRTFPVLYSVKHASKIHCITKHTQNLVRGLVPGRERDMVVFPPPIDLATFRRPRGPRTIQMITVSRLERAKNLDNVIRALKYLPTELLADLRYVIAGNGTDAARLRGLVEELGLSEHVIFAGQVSDEDKVDLLCHSKLFVLCPILLNGQEEGFGISFIEAQAAGLPVIASRTGGIHEAVGDAGIYVDDPLDPAEIAGRITLVLQDPILYERLEQAGRARVVSFGMPTWSEKVGRLYAAALGK